MSTYVKVNYPSNVDVEKEASELQKNLPFEDPGKYDGICGYHSKLMQISELGKGKSFGDTNIQLDWINSKVKGEHRSE